jgi:hypothetical protein
VRVLLVVLASLVLVGGATAANGEPKKVLTKKDQATATSVLLKRADLGAGFVARKRPDDDGIPKGARCGPLDESDLTVSGDAESPDFHFATGSLFVTVTSTAQVYRTLREANSSWSRGTTAQTTTCLADIVRLTAAPGQKISVVSSKKLDFPAVAQKSTAFRLVLSISVNGRKIRAYLDAIVLQQGRIQSGLLFTSLGTPVGRADQVALASVVAKRLARAVGAPTGPVA